MIKGYFHSWSLINLHGINLQDSEVYASDRVPDTTRLSNSQKLGIKCLIWNTKLMLYIIYDPHLSIHATYTKEPVLFEQHVLEITTRKGHQLKDDDP